MGAPYRTFCFSLLHIFICFAALINHGVANPTTPQIGYKID